MKIDVISSFVNGEKADYFRHNLLSLSSGDNLFNFKCIVDQFVDTEWNVIIDKQANDYANGLNASHKYIESEYFIIVHTDIALLKKHWDVEIINDLDQFTHAIGCNCCFNANSTYFTEIFVIGKSEILLKILPDWNPVYHLLALKTNGKRVIQRKEIKFADESDYYGIPVGGTFKQDVSTRVALKYKNYGYKWKILRSGESQLPYDRSTLDKYLSKKFKIHQQNYIRDFTYNSNLFLSHFGKSNRYGVNSPVFKVWNDAVSNYIKLINEK